MRYPSSSANRSRSRGDRYTRYSLGAYMRESDSDLCSSISRASLRAISTGRTSDLKARLKVPSTRPAILLSRLLRTLMGTPWGLIHATEIVLQGQLDDGWVAR